MQGRPQHPIFLSGAQSTAKMQAANMRVNHSQAGFPFNGCNKVADPHTPGPTCLAPSEPCAGHSEHSSSRPCSSLRGTGRLRDHSPPSFPGPALSGWDIHGPSETRQNQWEGGFWNKKPTPEPWGLKVDMLLHRLTLTDGLCFTPQAGAGVDIRNLSRLPGQVKCLQTEMMPSVPIWNPCCSGKSQGKTGFIYCPPTNSLSLLLSWG